MSRDRSRRSLQRSRRHPLRSGDIILIVCEGKKTEPKYFEGLRKKWKLRAARIEVVGRGRAPINVVDYALKLRSEREGDVTYDEVWCVLDHEGKNRHKTLDRACAKAKSNGLLVALSVPSFEFWYLLHFKFTTRRFADSDAVVRELKKHIRNYKKSEAPLDALLPHLNEALDNALRVREDNAKANKDWPSTQVDIVVKKLQSLRSPGSIDYP